MEEEEEITAVQQNLAAWRRTGIGGEMSDGVLGAQCFHLFLESCTLLCYAMLPVLFAPRADPDQGNLGFSPGSRPKAQREIAK